MGRDFNGQSVFRDLGDDFVEEHGGQEIVDVVSSGRKGSQLGAPAFFGDGATQPLLTTGFWSRNDLK